MFTALEMTPTEYEEELKREQFEKVDMTQNDDTGCSQCELYSDDSLDCFSLDDDEESLF